MARFAIDVTACWRPRVGMVTVATELARALVTERDGDAYTLLCSRERPQSLSDLDCDAVLAPYRHELALKLRWLPAVESRLGGDAILYPYWPSPPRRQSGAPPAAMTMMVVTRGVRYAIAGSAAGAGLAVLAGRWLLSSSFGIRSTDGFVVLAIAIALAVIGAIASWWPGHQASRVDMLEAISAE